MFGGILGLIIQLIAGAVGGNIVGAAAKGLLNDNCFDYGGGFGSIV